MELIRWFSRKKQEGSSRLVFEGSQYFREKHYSILEDLEKDALLEGGLLYDFSQYYARMTGGVVLPISSPDTQYDNTNQFRWWFQSFFQRKMIDKDEVLVEIEVCLEKLLQDYAERLSSQKDISDARKKELIKKWEQRTSALIWDIYCTSYYAAFGGAYLSSRDILKRSVWAINRRKEDILYPQKRFDPHNVLLYNMWGEDYSRKKADLQKNLIGLSSEQKPLLYSDENKESFNLYFSSKYEAAICVDGKSQEQYISAELDAMTFLESLFNDYIKRLRRAGIYDEAGTESAVHQWMDVTLSEITRIAFIDEVSTVLCSPSFSMPPDFRDVMVTQVEYDKICRIRSLADRCRAFINGFVHDYLMMINAGCLTKSWSVTLMEAGIDFRGLFTDMKTEKIIDPSIDYVAFEDAFRSADFSLLIESARYMDSINRRQGRAGFIQLLIRVVGTKLENEDWYYSAAESVYPKYKGKEAKEAVEKLRPTKFSEDYAKKILQARIPGYKY